MAGWCFAGSDLIGVYPYVEHTAFPLVRVFSRLGGLITQTAGGQPVTSGRSVSVVGDTLLVLFGGEEGRGWVLGRYDVRNGQYLHSDLLPHFSNRAAVGDDGRVFTLYSAGMFPVIVALMRRVADAGAITSTRSSIKPTTPRRISWGKGSAGWRRRGGLAISYLLSPTKRLAGVADQFADTRDRQDGFADTKRAM